MNEQKNGIDQYCFNRAPDWAEFAALQNDGFVRWFEKEPYLPAGDSTSWSSFGIELRSGIHCTLNKTKIWKHTVTKRERHDIFAAAAIGEDME